MQMKSLAAMTALATVAASTPVALEDRRAVPVFHVTKFHTLCTETVSNECTSSFGLSVNALPAANCSIQWSATDFILCGAISPEQAYYAYVEKPAKGQKVRTLQVKYEESIPGSTNHDIWGSTFVNHTSPNFSFTASKEAV